MAITYRLTQACNDGAASITNTVTIAADETLNIDADVDGVAQVVACSFEYAKLLTFFATSNVNTTIHINNNTTSPNNISLLANEPMLWIAQDSYFANPFNTNVTALYVTAVGARLTVRMQLDS